MYTLSIQVGTLDVLVGLSDDLGKLDTFCEGYVLHMCISTDVLEKKKLVVV